MLEHRCISNRCRQRSSSGIGLACGFDARSGNSPSRTPDFPCFWAEGIIFAQIEHIRVALEFGFFHALIPPVLFLNEIWWRCMGIEMHGAFLHKVSARLVQYARGDIRTRSVWSVERSIASLGLKCLPRHNLVVAVAQMRLRQATVPSTLLKSLINQQSCQCTGRSKVV